MSIEEFIEKVKSFGRSEGKYKKRVLFLENGNSYLTADLNLFKNILIENKIESSILFPLEELPMKVIADYINQYDIFVFQTTWRSENSQMLLKNMDKFTEPKTIIELYIHKPLMYFNRSKIHQWVNMQTDDTINFNEWDIEIFPPELPDSPVA